MADTQLWTGPVIDTHHHFWDLERHYYPWLNDAALVPHRYGDYTPIKRTYLMDDYLRDIAGQNVVSSVYCEAEWDPRDPLGEARYVHETAAQHGYPGAMVAQAWLHEPNAAAVLAAQAAFPLVRSVRHKPGGPDAPDKVGKGAHTLMLDDGWRKGYAELEKHGLHFDLQTQWWNLHEAALLARDFPRTLIVVNHTGVPGRDAVALAGWRQNMRILADMPNIVVKISGLCVAGQPWTVESNQGIVRDVITMFEPVRVMFGSNFPVDGMIAGFAQIFDGFRHMVSGYDMQDQRAMFHDTAARVYRPVVKTVA